MEEDKILLSNIEDKIEQAYSKNYFTFSNFLDMRQASIVRNYCKYTKNVQVWFCGGYDEAERIITVFLPEYLYCDTLEDLKETVFNSDLSPISLIHAEKDTFHTLTHRDYLGALMGIGIKREMIGDILVNENGADIIVMSKIAPFILENLNGAGRATLTLSTRSLQELEAAEFSTQEEFYTVSSLRADVVSAALFKLSRKEISEIIQKGLLFVNGVEVTKAEKTLNENDKIVIRGKGKCVLSEIQGLSKKGKTRINITRYT